MHSALVTKRNVNASAHSHFPPTGDDLWSDPPPGAQIVPRVADRAGFFVDCVYLLSVHSRQAGGMGNSDTGYGREQTLRDGWVVRRTRR